MHLSYTLSCCRQLESLTVFLSYLKDQVVDVNSPLDFRLHPSLEFFYEFGIALDPGSSNRPVCSVVLPHEVSDVRQRQSHCVKMQDLDDHPLWVGSSLKAITLNEKSLAVLAPITLFRDILILEPAFIVRLDHNVGTS